MNSLEYIQSNKYLESYVKLISVIAKKAADLGAGEGILFNSHDEKIQDFWDRFAIEQNLSTKIWKFFYQNSLIGRSHFWLSKNKDNKYDLILNEIFSNVRVSIFNENEVAAQIFTAKNQGDKGHYFQYDFYSNKLKITKYIDDNEALVGSVITEVPKSAQRVEEMIYETEIDIVPIIETTNLPKPHYMTANTLIFHPDWEPAFNLLMDEQEIIKQKRKERKKNQTWFNGVLTPELMKAISDVGGDLVSILKDGLLQNNVNQYTKGQQTGFNITLGNPPLENYNNDWLFTEIQIFNACGYNHPREAENKSYQNKAQTLMNGILDEQTTRIKQQYYKTKLFRLFDYILIANKLWDPNTDPNRPYDFDFKSIGLADILQKDTLISSRLLNGTMSKIQAIQQYDNLNEFNARKEMEIIQEEQVEYEYDNQEQELNEQDIKDGKIESKAGDLSKEIK